MLYKKYSLGFFYFSDVPHLVYYQLRLNIDNYYFISGASKCLLYFPKSNDYGDVFSCIFSYVCANTVFAF